MKSLFLILNCFEDESIRFRIMNDSKFSKIRDAESYLNMNCNEIFAQIPLTETNKTKLKLMVDLIN